MDWIKTTERRNEKHLSLEILVRLILEILRDLFLRNTYISEGHYCSYLICNEVYSHGFHPFHHI